MFEKPKSVSNYTWGVGEFHSKFSVMGVSWRQKNIPGIALFNTLLEYFRSFLVQDFDGIDPLAWVPGGG